MKFTLTFDGQLRPNGTPTEKWAIRQHLHPQLQELWSIHPLLKSLKRAPYLPKEGRFYHTEQHHSVETPLPQAEPQPEDLDKWINLCAEIERGGRRFLPLVRETLALKCSLKIQFLRKEDAGHIVYQGGDLDNRIKTLFDGLSVPNQDQVILEETTIGIALGKSQIRWCGTSRPDLGERWPSRLVATEEEDRLSIRGAARSVVCHPRCGTFTVTN